MFLSDEGAASKPFKFTPVVMLSPSLRVLYDPLSTTADLSKVFVVSMPEEFPFEGEQLISPSPPQKSEHQLQRERRIAEDAAKRLTLDSYIELAV